MDAQLHNIELMEKWLSLDSLSNDILPILALLKKPIKTTGIAGSRIPKSNKICQILQV